MRAQRLRFVLALAMSVLLTACGVSEGQTTVTPTTNPHLVRLTVGTTSYHPTDTINVTIANQGASTIYFQDHQTVCTVIQLQIQTAGAWQAVFVCAALTPTGVHSLVAGQTQVIVLSAPQGGWQSGDYRAALAYGHVPTPNATHAFVGYSDAFHVSV